MNAARALMRRVPGGHLGRGVVTLVAGTTASQLILIASAPVLTRLYDPASVGAYSVAVSILSVMITLTCLRYEFAIPLPKSDDAGANVLAVALLVNLLMSIATAVALFVVGPALFDAIGASALGRFAPLLALGQLGAGTIAAFTGWAVRTRTFGWIASTRLTQSVVLAGSQIALGLAGLGSVGLLIGDSVGRLSGSTRLARTAWERHRDAFRGVSWARIRATAIRYRRFPLLQSGSALINSLGAEAPLLLLVFAYGTTEGGQYALAQRIVALPVALVATAVGQVFVGEGARLAHDDRAGLRSLFVSTTRSLAAGAVVPGILLAVLAPILAVPIFGAAWREAGLFVAILAPMYYLQLVTSPTGGILDIFERQDLSVIRELLRLFFVGGAVVVAAALELPAIEAVAILSLAGCLTYVIYGLISWRALREGWPPHVYAARRALELEEAAAEAAAFGAAEVGSPPAVEPTPDGGGEADPEAGRGPDGGHPSNVVATPHPLPVGPPPRLLVEAPRDHPARRRYILDLVLGEWLGFPFDVAWVEPGSADGHVMIHLADDPLGRGLRVPDRLLATPDGTWLTEASMPPLPVPRLTLPASAIDRHDDAWPLPSLFGSAATDGPAWHPTPGGLDLAVDVFGSAFFLLTRYEELVRPERDPHDRFPATAAIATTEGFLGRPLVDDYVELLALAIEQLWPNLPRRTRRFELRLTHDIDEPWATIGRPLRVVGRAVAGDLVRRRDPGLAARRTASFMRARAGSVHGDPYDTFDFLMETSERHGLRSTFYVMAGNTAGAIDGTYHPTDPLIAALLRRIHDRGHDLGLHASYGTYREPALVRRELDALRAACAAAGFDQPAWGVRHHFLRFANPDTWRAHEQAGLEHDSTIGFADQVGFRAGTGRSYPVFDLLADRRLAICERPLLVMDTTLFDYLAVGIGEAAPRIRAIVDAARPGGEAVLLFHNSTLAGARRRGEYRELIEALSLR